MYMKVIVVDNEPLVRERLERLISQAGHEIVGTFAGLSEVADKMRVSRPHLLIIDEDIDGSFAFCGSLVQTVGYQPAVILIGAGQLCLQAYQAGVHDYLVSPVGKNDLIQSLHKISTPTAVQMLFCACQKKSAPKKARQYISARTHRGVELIALSDVYYFSADQKYVKVCHKGGTVLIDETLKELEEEFGNAMFRIHRNALVNLEYLDLLEVLPQSRYQVRFRGIDEALAVSRRHLPALREKIHNI